MDKAIAICLTALLLLSGCLGASDDDDPISIVGCDDENSLTYQENATESNDELCASEELLESGIFEFIELMEDGPDLTEVDSTMGYTMEVSSEDNWSYMETVVVNPTGYKVTSQNNYEDYTTVEEMIISGNQIQYTMIEDGESMQVRMKHAGTYEEVINTLMNGDEDDESMFLCDNGEEIPQSWVNDGEEDCDDGSDEGVEGNDRNSDDTEGRQSTQITSLDITQEGDIVTIAITGDFSDDPATAPYYTMMLIKNGNDPEYAITNIQEEDNFNSWDYLEWGYAEMYIESDGLLGGNYFDVEFSVWLENQSSDTAVSSQFTFYVAESDNSDDGDAEMVCYDMGSHMILYDIDNAEDCEDGDYMWVDVDSDPNDLTDDDHGDDGGMDMGDDGEDPTSSDYTVYFTPNATFTGFDKTESGMTFTGLLNIEGAPFGHLEVYTTEDFTVTGFALMDVESSSNWVKFMLINSGNTIVDETLPLDALPFMLIEWDTSAGSDDSDDGEEMFRCDNGEEIRLSWVNDGMEDCDDGSDEGVTFVDMVCHDMSTHTNDYSIDNQEDCEDAGFIWTEDTGHSDDRDEDGHDDHDYSDEEHYTVAVLFPDNVSTMLSVNSNDMDNVSAWNLTMEAMSMDNITLNYSVDPTYGTLLTGIGGVIAPSDYSWWWSLYLWNDTSETWDESQVGVDSVTMGEDTEHIAWAASNANMDLLLVPGERDDYDHDDYNQDMYMCINFVDESVLDSTGNFSSVFNNSNLDYSLCDTSAEDVNYTFDNSSFTLPTHMMYESCWEEQPNVTMCDYGTIEAVNGSELYNTYAMNDDESPDDCDGLYKNESNLCTEWMGNVTDSDANGFTISDGEDEIIIFYEYDSQLSSGILIVVSEEDNDDYDGEGDYDRSWSFDREMQDCDYNDDSMVSYDELETCINEDLANDGFENMNASDIGADEVFNMSDMNNDSMLNESEFDYLNSMLSQNDDDPNYQDMFSMMDSDEDGEVTFSEWQDMDNQSDEPMSEDDLSRFALIINFFDEDNSGGLDLSEYENMMFRLDSGDDGMDVDPEFMFAIIDSNTDGVVTLEEWIASSNNSDDGPMTQEDIDGLSNMMDMFDEDDSMGLNYSEFAAMMEMMNDGDMEDNPEFLFALIDSNGDGEVTASEWADAGNESGDEEPMTEEDFAMLSAMVDNYDEDSSGGLNYSEFTTMFDAMDEDGESDMFEDRVMFLVFGMEGLEGDLDDYSVVLALCTQEMDSMTGMMISSDCGEDVYSVQLSSILIESEADMVFSGNAVMFIDSDESGTLTTGDMLMIDTSSLDVDGEWNGARLHSEEAESYSDENPMMMPGFTGILATIGLLGAALIRRE